MSNAVIFDVFGTLLQIRNRQNPYRLLLREGARQGRPVSPTDLRALMTFNGGIAEAAAAFEITLSPQKLMELQSALEIELKSIQPFDDALPALDMIRNRGMKIGVCSNLLQPYCATVRRMLPGLNGYALSPEVGVMKPDPRMYQSACHLLGLEPGSAPDAGSRVLMIGDSPKCDRDGPRQVGIMGYHLDRSGKGRFGDLLAFGHVLTASD